MRYWVYINEKVEGPYQETDLVTLPGFTPETLICTEESASSGGQEWQKASAVFEFDEIPEETPTTTLPSLEQNVPVSNPSSVSQTSVDTAALLAKLDLLSNEMSNLQSKMDSMQINLDAALERNQQLVQQAVAVQPQEEQNALPSISQEEPAVQEEPKEEEKSVEPANAPIQVAPEEEEVIIRSALDSIYGGKLVSEGDASSEDAFQDLLTEQKPKTAEQIAQELEFIPLTDETQGKEETKENPEALITTPSLDEASKDALIHELTASPKEDILDQIIQERQQEASAEEQSSGTVGTLAAGLAVAAAGVAGASFKIAPNKDNPDQLESVLPAEDMPKDVPVENQAVESDYLDLPGLENTMHEVVFEESASEENPVSAQEETSVPAEEPEQAPIDLSDMAEETATETKPEGNLEEETPVSAEEQEKFSWENASNSQEQFVPPVEEGDSLPAEADSQESAGEFNLDEMPATMPESNPDFSSEESSSQPADLPDLDSVNDVTPEGPQSEENSATNGADLPGLDQAEQFDSEVVTQPQEAEKEESSDEQDEIEELVPQDRSADLVSDSEALAQQDLEEGSLDLRTDAEKSSEDASQQQPEAEETATPDQNETEGVTETRSLLDGVDLTVPAENLQAESTRITEAMSVGNPNDLTEIELKEGSTYLISDFVPPAQLTDDVAEVMKSAQKKQEGEDPDSAQKTESAFQDMLATTKQHTEPLATEGLPEDVAATAVNLENTIQAKRGPSLDIKTVPMVPEPEKTNRLDVNDLNDVTVQHDLKRTGFRLSKMIIGILIGLLLVIVYIVLGLVHVLPNSINLFGNKKVAKPAVSEAVSEPVNELLPEATKPEASPAGEEIVSEEAEDIAAAQLKVQEFPLPNGYLLQGFISSKHPLVALEDITWTTTDAVEADNYSVTVKAPPDNPQSLQTAYRFNYNMKTGILNPTNSDAKNLLDQAYAAVQASAKKRTTRRRSGTRSR